MIKYKIYVVFLLFLSICAFGFVRASDNDLPLLGKVIYIDAGHPSEIKPSINRTSCSKL